MRIYKPYNINHKVSLKLLKRMKMSRNLKPSERPVVVYITLVSVVVSAVAACLALIPSYWRTFKPSTTPFDCSRGVLGLCKK